MNDGFLKNLEQKLGKKPYFSRQGSGIEIGFEILV